MFDVGKFFSRPVRIGSFPWTVNTAFVGQSIFPFELFWKNKHNANRLNNYRNMKCDMCVKIVVNGTPFHYGMILASVTPDQSLEGFPNSDLTELGCVRGSQNPHIFIDASTSSAGCLRLPYTHPSNAFDTLGTNLQSAGTLALRELVPLAHVSGVVETITVSVFAWAENVVLGAPTINNISGLTAQSSDEYGQGVISRPAFALAAVAKSMVKFPYIRPYAMATDMTATSIGNLASLFGFVKPNVVSDITLMNPRALPNLASATQHDPIFKATLDDKQGVTVDPRVVGFDGRDEMGILDIAMRESYLFQFPYTQTNAVDSRLCVLTISPNQYRTSGTGINTQFIQTPMSWVSAPFQYWRGSIRYKLTAVCSAFHRGRLRIAYEPAGSTAGLVPSFNVVMSEIWDISEKKEIVIDVGWHQPNPYMQVSNIGDGINPFVIGVTGNIVANPFRNGTISVYVLNELTSPDTSLTSPISILVSVSACEDFELFSPIDTISNFTYHAQSGEVLENSIIKPYKSEADVKFGSRIRSNDPSPKIFHGDPVISLRTLLKRYTYSCAYSPTFTAVGVQRFSWRLVLPQMPLYPGRAPLAVHTATTAINFSSMTLLNYFTPAFLARRGGIRHRFIAGIGCPIEHAAIYRAPVAGYTNTTTLFPAITTPSVAARAHRVEHRGVTNGVSGMSATPDIERIPLDIEVPFYSPLRYFRGRDGGTNRGSSSGAGVTILVKFVTSSGSDVILEQYVSAADDFSLHGFIDVPPMYNHTTVPAAT
ncbi:hypothetical protein 2 [Sanxia picorna-like virus 5]|uniref:hypothetical protein 2 n=1 Tax=Sanxia picorna-like virus 5 TaxID=1923374 RepID=UPI00090BC399|nr:hypothetical protein 2 [Sanxia picorna-like virus 5]APG77487.1 hypothetical protein 2 [Sanxia picorna-like virus 5]